MQMQMPVYPKETKLINGSVGVYELEGMVYYLHHGSPLFCHKLEDKNSYRYILGNLVHNRLARISEISHVLGINRKNVERYAKALKDNGIDWFFNREDNRGKCHQMTDHKMGEAQKLIDEGLSNKVIGERIGVSEGPGQKTCKPPKTLSAGHDRILGKQQRRDALLLCHGGSK